MGVCIQPAKDTYVFPAQGRLAVLTVDISYSVQACEQNSLLRWATPNVHPERRDGEGESRERGTKVQNLSCVSGSSGSVVHTV